MGEEGGLEEIKKKKLEARKAEEQLKAGLRTALEDGAYERIMNVSVANKEFFLLAAKNVLMLFKRAGRKLKDDELLMLLRRIKEQSETETKITFRTK